MRFVPAASYYSGRNRSIRLIVVHSTQGPGAPSWKVPTADGIAGYFSRGPGVSSHHVCDETETIQCVRDEDTAWCAPGANADGIHIEQCGYAEWSRAEWLTGDNLVMIRDQVAPLVASLCAKHGIPLRALTVAQIQAGQAGVCDHYDITNAYPGGSHWDCGEGYPMDALLGYAIAQEDDDMFEDRDRATIAQLAKTVTGGAERAEANFRTVGHMLADPNGAVQAQFATVGRMLADLANMQRGVIDALARDDAPPPSLDDALAQASAAQLLAALNAKVG